MKSHSLRHLTPETYDSIMRHVTAPDPDLLALARALAVHVTTDTTANDETRYSFRLHGTTFVTRASDDGFGGDLSRLCSWIDAHRPVDEPAVDDEDTQQLSAGGNV